MRILRLGVVAGLAIGAVCAAGGAARAFDTTPWSTAPFGQPRLMPAWASAAVSGALAEANALAAKANTTAGQVPGVTVGAGNANCTVNVGGTTLTNGFGGSVSITNVKGNIVVACQ